VRERKQRQEQTGHEGRKNYRVEEKKEVRKKKNRKDEEKERERNALEKASTCM